MADSGRKPRCRAQIPTSAVSYLVVSNLASKITIGLAVCAVSVHISVFNADVWPTITGPNLPGSVENSQLCCTPARPQRGMISASNWRVPANMEDFSLRHEHLPSNGGLEEFQFWLPAGGSLVLGSLDKTAGLHALRIAWRPEPIPASRFETQDIFSLGPACWDIAFRQSPSVVLHENRFPLPPPVVFESRSASEDSEQVLQIPPCNVRRFSIPCFTECGTFDRHELGKLVSQGTRTHVFLAERNVLNADVELLAKTITATLDGPLRSVVEGQLGQIRDVDGDQRLTVILSSLSTNQRRACERNPINGCVRANDFLDMESECGGDIIYIDVHAPSGQELTAILAHELAHAATFSAIHQSADYLNTASEPTPMPSWLNEAIAHYIEKQICPNSKNLQQRIARFTQSPNAFPLVIPDDMRQTSNHRGPTRAAGCLFMQSIMHSVEPADLRLIAKNPIKWSESLEQLTGQSFAELFRNWSVRMSGSNQVTSNLLNGPISTKIAVRGTSFCCCHASASGGFVTVYAAPESQVQVTVIRPSVGQNGAIALATKFAPRSITE